MFNDLEEEPVEIITAKNDPLEPVFYQDKTLNKDLSFEIEEEVETIRPKPKNEVEVEVKETEHKNVSTTLKSYQLPSISLLKNNTQKQNHQEISKFAKENAIKLIDVLQQFGVKATIKDVYVGPSVTKYEITLETGTRVNKILQLTDDIKMALAAKDIRIEAPDSRKISCRGRNSKSCVKYGDF